ncbi:DarT ssDNA thymidine ADP-ribosyltransferase family protein [Variovorax sp. J22G21]|uniref:DarT ssDNA thymidine ADP-ribosyltransferase family protein n=1 Tax=Variovorax fucosicus TaxID=3053517 RepID=UPI00257557F4|nr:MULTISPECIES: DarT ssDNA thymidine ADP-ribosyltransferase family protein [unclassified Variovorax]MDM0038785.1 DarT ssDNA thymidine ADP-ribosyltransferase family protein [Variovorax sp. J22R193]MDM0063561.1 DarT ssDNA thymidine ADP-ribosyltransferase family protein [Variovorax sp. J22G21]
MNIAEIIATRRIESILHFTSNKGSLGILDARAIKARARLNKDERLEHIFMPNAADRSRDEKWLDYVNLSISRINESFFNVSAGSWHKEKDFWWCIFDFSPDILNHQGVYFTTTNNMYSGVKRNQGGDALEAAFGRRIVQWSSSRSSSIIQRDVALSPALTTCAQAEILYPGELSTDFLQAVYVSADEFADELASQCSVVGHPAVDIRVRPELFGSIK